MFRTMLRAAIIAIAGAVIAVPALATGKVETAWQLWTGDLKSAYDATVRSVESGNIDQAKSDVSNLVDKLSRMNDAVSSVVSAGNSLSPELGALWTDSQSAVSRLHDAAKSLQSTLGSSTPDLGNLKSAQTNADSAIMKSRDGSNRFAQYYIELTDSDGYITASNDLFRNGVTDAYTRLFDDLSEGDIESGRGYLATLRSRGDELRVLATKGRDGAKAFSNRLGDLWTPVVDAIPDLLINIGALEQHVGKQDYKNDLEELREAHGKLNDTIKSAYSAVQDFGSKLKEFTDDAF